MADKKISELDLALQINNDAVFPMSQDNAGEPTTFKAGITQLGTEIAEDMTFSNLSTTSKKLVGAINELLSLGSPIIIGTSAPTSSIGADGNLYIQYTAGTGGADDEVDGIFVKIDGAWCEIQTGGGGGAGGHTIVDDSGTTLTQRTNLQFKGAYSEDNSAYDTTEVNVVREMTKAEFDELTEAEKTGLINITDITGGNDDRFQPVVYSEEEQEIGVWIDGKPLYEKVFTISQLTVSSSWTNTTIDTTDIDTVASAFGIAPDGTFYSGLDGDPTASSHTVLSLRSYATSYIVKLILQYTKISDTAGSGQWTPQGVPAHHYSEDEQVVGTWIDGSTLYEKTVYISALPNNSTGEYSTGLSNITPISFDNTLIFQSGNTSKAPYLNMSNNVRIAIQFNADGKIYFGTNTDQSTTSAYVTIRYTKPA